MFTIDCFDMVNLMIYLIYLGSQVKHGHGLHLFKISVESLLYDSMIIWKFPEMEVPLNHQF